MDLTRGERNHNPFNLREGYRDRTAWMGERATDDDSAFEEFTKPEFGIRAGCKVLLAYYRKHKLRTVRGIIRRFAPAIENDTNVYVYNVCRIVGVKEDEQINLEDEAMLESLARAIMHHENGRVIYEDSVIAVGVAAAFA